MTADCHINRTLAASAPTTMITQWGTTAAINNSSKLNHGKDMVDKQTATAAKYSATLYTQQIL